MKRRTVLQGISAAGGAISVPTVAAKRNTYERHETDEKLSRIGTQIAFHKSHDRAAFISAAFEPGIELYIAEGVSTASDVPTEVYQLTADTPGGVYNPRWRGGNVLRFQRNLSDYSISIPRSYRVLEHKLVRESVVDVDRTLENAEWVTDR